MIRRIVIYMLCVIALSCETKRNQKSTSTIARLKQGDWLATLMVQDNEQLPFNVKVLNDNSLTIHNDVEVIKVDEVEIKGDSIWFQTPVFEGYIDGLINKSGTLVTGSFIKPSLDRVVPFTMQYGEAVRFPGASTASENVSGNWEAVFSPDNEADRYIAKGTFRQNGNLVTGTFRTTTGDYRYLQGVVDVDRLKLSTFDGAHAFLFTAQVEGDSLIGTFYSGNHFKEPFRAKRNPNYELPDATSLTYIKEGYDGMAFSFPDANGNMISLEDDRFKDKVVLVQIMGTWCPNCLEESKYYVNYLNEHFDQDLEIIALAFEYAPTPEKAFVSIQRLKDRLGITYPILLAQYGTEDKKLAQEKLPMLNHVLSYPTTIFIDKKGAVRRIHTGFNGKATGDKHVAFKKEFETFVAVLLDEQ